MRRPKIDTVLARLSGVQGHVDGIVGGTLVGWAKAVGDDTRAVRVGLYARGVLLAQTTADIHRGDLQAAGIGQGRHGFAIALGDTLASVIAANGGVADVYALDPRRRRIGQCRIEPAARKGGRGGHPEASGRVRGNVDGVIGGKLVGWAEPLGGDDRELRVGLYVGGALLAQAPANVHRVDLEAAGVGNGHHGFVIAVTDALAGMVAANGGEAEVCVIGPEPVRIGTWRPDLSGLATEPGSGLVFSGPHAPLQRLLFSDLHLLGRLLDSTLPNSTDPRPLPPIHAKLLDRRDYLHPGTTLPERMYCYAEYLRYRDRLDEQFDTAADPDDIAHFFKRFLRHYSAMRGGLRVPMSKAAIDWLNEPVVIGGVRRSFSRAMWSFLLDQPHLVASIDFDDDDWYGFAVYWWAWRQAQAIHCEDCLVPAFMAETLRRVPADHAGQDWAPTDFLMRLRHETPELLELDLDKGDDRRRLVCAVMVMAVSHPACLRYIDPAALAAALDDSDGPMPLAQFVAEIGGRLDLTAAGYAAALRRQGFDIGRMRFLSFTAEGHRLEYAALPPVAEGEPVDVQIIGPFYKASGLGQATRLSADMLERSGVTVNKVDFGLDNPAPEGFSRSETVADYRKARINLIHLNAEAIPMVYAYQPDAFTGAYNIGYFFWELDSPGACHYLGMDMLDEIWVSSEFGVQVYQPHTDRPVVNVGMSFERLPEIDAAEARAFLRRQTGLKEDDFAFLVTFDSFSFVQRKNPLGVLAAFRAAFPDEPGVRLVIKTQNRARIADPAQLRIWDQVDAVLAQDDRIVLVNETLAYEDLLRLKRGADAYLSLHRSEGWGFGMIEAMNLGVPVICTAYSGNMDFCSERTCWLVDYRMTELGPDDYIFVRPGQKWAEPDVADAARQMRAVFDDPAEARRRADAARAFVHDAFGEEAISARYGARLHEILVGISTARRGAAE